MNALSTFDANMSSQQEAALQALLNEVSSLLQFDYNGIRGERFVKGVFCPHCMQETGQQVSDYILYGHVNNTPWQRYRCRQCRFVFSDLTGTLFHRSRNVRKWPLFIHYILVDRLPMKEIAGKLELHINTIYAWNKKLTAFFELFLPNRQFQSRDQDTHDYMTVEISCFNQKTSDYIPQQASPPTIVPVTLAVNCENPSQILYSCSKQQKHANKAPSPELDRLVQSFKDFIAQKRGVRVETIRRYLTYFRMLRLSEALNPANLAAEVFKTCLDKGCLSKSNRLLKRLI